MRISVKGRYALAAAIHMAGQYDSGRHIAAISISDSLGISKIYLEQVLSLLKRGGVVNSVKGAQGGYLLTRPPQLITAFDILSAAELSIFESTEKTTADTFPEIEAAMRVSVFEEIDKAVKSTLEKITLKDLVEQSEAHRTKQGYMFYL